MKYDTIIIGHITIDINVFPWGLIENVLGGAPTYTGFALKKLKKNIGIVSKLGQDFPERFSPIFNKFGLDTEGILLTSGRTTTFKNNYDGEGDREQICEAVAPSIKPSEIPPLYNETRSIYISPVANEVSPELIESVKNDNKTLMFDPQGIFREIRNDGKVKIKKPDNLEEYLKNVDIVKLGKEEFRSFNQSERDVLRKLACMGPKIAILTLGEEGCMIFYEDKIKKISGIEVEVKDLTGAGDVFGAGFLSSYMETGNPFKSAKIGAVTAGLKLKYKGPAGFPDRKEIIELI